MRRRRPPEPVAPFVPPEPSRRGEVTWLQAYPDALLERVADPSPGPEAERDLAGRFADRFTADDIDGVVALLTQPAYGLYVTDPQPPVARFAGLLVLTPAGDRIGAITRFLDPSLADRFGLPATLA